MTELPINQILVGDALERLRELPDESVHCVITSPPYWGLRDYGVAGQLGLEATPAEYVEKMVGVFREVRRILRHDGTLWLNLGDCYATGAAAVGNCPGGGEQGARWRGEVNRLRDEKRGYRGERLANGRGDSPAIQRKKSIDCGPRGPRNGHEGKQEYAAAVGPITQPNRMPIPGLKPKDLVGIPWRLAFALQADGWYLRSDIIWAKPNPMPESVTDRPTKAHEYVFLLTKSERYFYDAEAIREPDAGTDHQRWVLDAEPSLEPSGGLRAPHGGIRTAEGRNGTGRNRRTVWSIATQPYPEAHFATFPETLVEPCILAGTSEQGACARCMTSLDRVMEKPGGAFHDHLRDGEQGQSQEGARRKRQYLENLSKPRGTIGWRRTCVCEGALVAPCIVLDPFMGAGTVALVALKARRNFIGIELNPEYAEMARRRIEPELSQLRLL